MSGIYQKANPIRSKDGEKARKKWAAKIDHCQICGISRENAQRRDGGVPCAVHHIIRGSRSDEPTNWLLVCHRDHGMIHSDVYRDEDGNELPRLSLGIILTIKQLRCPKEYDRERLEQLFGQALVDELPIPEFFEREWETNRPGKKRLFKQIETKVDSVVEVKEPKKASKGKQRCKRCIRLNLHIKCGNCDSINE